MFARRVFASPERHFARVRRGSEVQDDVVSGLGATHQRVALAGRIEWVPASRRLIRTAGRFHRCDRPRCDRTTAQGRRTPRRTRAGWCNQNPVCGEVAAGEGHGRSCARGSGRKMRRHHRRCHHAGSDRVVRAERLGEDSSRIDSHARQHRRQLGHEADRSKEIGVRARGDVETSEGLRREVPTDRVVTPRRRAGPRP